MHRKSSHFRTVFGKLTRYLELQAPENASWIECFNFPYGQVFAGPRLDDAFGDPDGKGPLHNNDRCVRSIDSGRLDALPRGQG